MSHFWQWQAVAVACVAALGCGSVEARESESEQAAGPVEEQGQELGRARSAVLHDASGARVGKVVFQSVRDVTSVVAAVWLEGVTEGMHGFHVHANDDPANGEGCIADPAETPETHFVSADGHYNPTGEPHGHHAGDMPALLVGAEGKATLSFLDDRFVPSDVVGRAVIVHEKSDNYGNVPTGTAPTEYSPNSEEATTLTRNTGNAGNRIACGVIQ